MTDRIRRMPGFRVAAAVSLALLAGCSATPTRYYTLVPPAPAPAPTTAPAVAPGGYYFALARVSVPQQIDVPQLVVRNGAGAVELLETDEWIAPINSEIRDALSLRLTRQLAASDVHNVATVEGSRIYRVNVDMQRFDSQLGGAATIAAVWSVRPPVEGQPILTCSTTITRPAGPTAASLTGAHQQALAELADHIAAGIRAMEAGGSAGCS